MSEEEEPLTRDDVLKMIEEHGGPNGLDLSGAIFVPGIDLSNMNLAGIILEKADLKGANLQHSDLQDRVNLQDANLSCANLEGTSLLYANLNGADLGKTKLKGASLSYAKMKKANLWAADLTYTELTDADLESAKLRGATLINTYISRANLSNASLYGADLSQAVGLSGINWGKNYIVGEEAEGYPATATEVYRSLKKCYTDAGIYDIAGNFYFREMTMKRKLMKWWPNPLPRAWVKLLSILCGYGEKPLRVIAWAAAVVLGLGSIYIAGAQSPLMAYYFSAVSFTALGYGAWINSSSIETWVKALGALEAFLGVFMMALFLVTFTRRMTR